MITDDERKGMVMGVFTSFFLHAIRYDMATSAENGVVNGRFLHDGDICMHEHEAMDEWMENLYID